jgi:hypothetical protein
MSHLSSVRREKNASGFQASGEDFCSGASQARRCLPPDGNFLVRATFGTAALAPSFLRELAGEVPGDDPHRQLTIVLPR